MKRRNARAYFGIILATSLITGCATTSLDPNVARAMADANRGAARGLTLSGKALEGAYGDAIDAAVRRCEPLGGPDAPAFQACAAEAVGPVDAKWEPVAAAHNALVRAQHAVASATEAFVGCLAVRDAACADGALRAYAAAWAAVDAKPAKGAGR